MCVVHLVTFIIYISVPFKCGQRAIYVCVWSNSVIFWHAKAHRERAGDNSGVEIRLVSRVDQSKSSRSVSPRVEEKIHDGTYVFEALQTLY